MPEAPRFWRPNRFRIDCFPTYKNAPPTISFEWDNDVETIGLKQVFDRYVESIRNRFETTTTATTTTDLEPPRKKQKMCQC